jgi:tRNA modification GTPase
MAELQLHGGRAVVAAVLAALGRIDGLRLAEPGEFTRRAFENGRLDLTAIEGLADLIYAETEAQRRQAYRHLKGFLGERAENWRARLVEGLALVEARIDFSDEADVPEDLVGPALAIAEVLRNEIAEALAGAAHGERLREGLVAAIAGPPNAGKSTLLNRIARREAAIVSPVAGTTRDVIEVHLDLAGYPVTLLDTAGIRDSVEPVEQEGVRRARQRAASSDLLLWVEDVREYVPQSSLQIPGGAAETWIVLNKIDLLPENKINIRRNKTCDILFHVSAATGEGVDRLLQAVGNRARNFFGSEPSLVGRERHRKALNAAMLALERALSEGSRGREDIIAEELRFAATSLGRLIGRVDVEDILDAIFRDFCIGK